MKPIFQASIFLAILLLTSCFSNSKKSSERWLSVVQDSSLRFQTIEKPGETHARLMLPNGLEVLMISSPSIQKSAAAMAVPVGSWADPKEYLGLAHFLEHMLFLGTKDFPTAGEFQNYLQSNSGYMNAYTAKETTNYMMEVNPQAFDGALHRFSQFFVSPTLDPQFSEREKNAVHSEYDKNIRDDGWRFWSVMSEIAPADHPLRKFNIGSLATLSKVDPKVLRDFYEKHYSADTMKLVVMSKQSISELRSMVEKYFQPVPNRGLKGIASNPVPPENWTGGQVVEMKTLESKNQMILTFPVPTFNGRWRTKPEVLLNNILGSKAKGSLLSQLKKQQLATDLAVFDYNMVEFGSDTSLMLVYIDLTDQGGQNRDQVIRQTLSYFAKIKSEGYKDYTFQENQIMARLEYENKAIKDGSGVAADYARKMLSYPALEIDERSRLIYESDAALIESYLEKMTPHKMSVLYLNQNVRGQKRDPFYGTEYRVVRLSDAQKKSFIQAYNQPGQDVHYPLKNPYIPTEFSLYKDAQSNYPEILSSTGGSVWFKQETSANTKPHGYLFLRILSREPGRSARESLLNQLYARAIVYSATEQLDQMQRAGYQANFSAGANGLEITLKGYSQAFASAAHALFASGENVLRTVNISEEAFLALRQSLQRDIESAEQDAAIQSLITDAGYFRTQNSYRLKDYKTEISKVSIKDLRDFVHRFYQKIALEGLVYGNLRKSELQDLSQNIFAATRSQILSQVEIQQILQKEIQLKPAQKIAYISTGANNNNAFISFVDTGPATPGQYALAQLVGNFVAADYYTELRSNQQLGYIVQGGFTERASKDIARFVFLIQSANHAPDLLIKKSDDFLKSFLLKLDEKVDSIFPTNVSSLVTQWRSRPTDMDGKFSDFSHLLKVREANWKFYEELIAEVQKITPPQAKEFAKKHFHPNSQARLSLYYSAQGKPAPRPAPGEKIIRSREQLIQEMRK